jgi:hypothetical protein
MPVVHEASVQVFCPLMIDGWAQNLDAMGVMFKTLYTEMKTHAYVTADVK